MLGGVAAGLAEYLDLDVTLVRVLFAIGFFSPVPVVLIYLVLWVVIPAGERLQISSGSEINS